MALAPLVLDDLSWSTLVDRARKRVAAVSRGQWTLHAPIDPGITLVELFAFLLDQRSYMLDQVPPSFVRATLALLGESTEYARAAGAALVFSAVATTAVPGRTPMRVDRLGGGAVFTTRYPITALPVKSIGLFVGSDDRTPDLAARRPVALVPSGAVTIALVFGAPLTVPALSRASLLVRLIGSASIAPDWSPDAVSDVPPPASVTWSYAKSDGALAPFASVIDGTGGLRRSGIVRFAIPADFATLDGGVWRARVVATLGNTFVAPPVVTSIDVNAATAKQSQWVIPPSQTIEWLPLPSRSLALATGRGLPLERRVVIRLRERDGAWHRWFETSDFLREGPGDRVFMLDRGRGVVKFGDGYNGRIPRLAAGTPNVDVLFDAGGGDAGNVGASDFVGVDGDFNAKSLDSAIGGVDSETPEDARVRAGASLHEHTRAITKDDFESIARETPGVAVRRAYAQVGLDPSHPCVKIPGATTVFIVPDLPARTDDEIAAGTAIADPEPDPGMLAVVRARFGTMRLVASQVFVRGPAYRDVALLISIEGDVHDPAALRDAVLSAIRRYVDPLVGGEDENGRPFGEPLRPTALLRVAQKALRRDGVVTAIALGVDGAPPTFACNDVALRPWELVRLASLDAKITLSTAQGGLG